MASSSAGSGDGGGGGGGQRFFNDRRFTLAVGPQRLRENVRDLLAEFNRQLTTGTHLREVAGQLNRLQDLLNANATETPESPGGLGQEGRADDGNLLQNIHVLRPNIELGAAHSNDMSPQRQGNGQPASIVLNMDLNEAGRSNSETDGLPQQQQQQQQQNHEHHENMQDHQQQAQQQQQPQQNVEIQRLQRMLSDPDTQRVLVTLSAFILLLLLKWIMVYATDIIMFVSVTASFYYVESALESVISSSAHRLQKCRLLSIVSLSLANIFALYFVYFDERQYLALIFNHSESLHDEDDRGIRLTTVLWLVITTDFVVKLALIVLKALVLVVLFATTTKRRGYVYQWIEYASHVYRYWLPAPAWIYYFKGGVATSGYLWSAMSTILAFTYMLCKLKFGGRKFSRLWQSTLAVIRAVPFGKRPLTTELMKMNNTCPICYGTFFNPVQLSCQHIFCEDCAITWLNRQKTCPMCRAQVTTGDNDWKDGRTSLTVQLM